MFTSIQGQSYSQSKALIQHQQELNACCWKPDMAVVCYGTELRHLRTIRVTTYRGYSSCRHQPRRLTHSRSFNSQAKTLRSIIIPISQMRKLVLRQNKTLAPITQRISGTIRLQTQIVWFQKPHSSMLPLSYQLPKSRTSSGFLSPTE